MGCGTSFPAIDPQRDHASTRDCAAFGDPMVFVGPRNDWTTERVERALVFRCEHYEMNGASFSYLRIFGRMIIAATAVPMAITIIVTQTFQLKPSACLAMGMCGRRMGCSSES